MLNSLDQWLTDPAVQKLVASLVGLIIIGFVVQLLHRAVTHRIQQTDTRHRVRRLINLAGFLLIAFVVAEEKGHLTIAVGVATAAVAFSLQEVIASVAGWVEISFGRFYQVGDRVELGGIVGDVIDVGVLRTTLFELGQWIGGDQHNGRIVRVANSLVFKDPVFNYSADFPFLRGEITVPVKYGSDRHHCGHDPEPRTAISPPDPPSAGAFAPCGCLASRVQPHRRQPPVSGQARQHQLHAELEEEKEGDVQNLS